MFAMQHDITFTPSKHTLHTMGWRGNWKGLSEDYAEKHRTASRLTRQNEEQRAGQQKLAAENKALKTEIAALKAQIATLKAAGKTKAAAPDATPETKDETVIKEDSQDATA